MKRPRIGCLTCRIRRIKCDAAKPSCLKCTSTGRTCDGYSALPFSQGDLLAASQRSKTPPKTDGSRDSSSSLVSRLISNDAFCGIAEKRYLQFFRHCTVASTNLTVDSRFWDSLILQACHAEPGIKHATLALASYHNSTITRSDPEVSRQHLSYAEQQCQRALSEAKLLIAAPSSKHIDRVLMVCVLFIVFENLRGNYAASRKHMNSGRSIAAQCWKRNEKSSQGGKSQDIAGVFARLDLFALSFSDASAPYDYTLDDLLQTAPELQPSSFDSIHDAHVSLLDLTRWLLVAGDQMIFRSDSLDPSLPYYQEHLAEARRRLLEWRHYWNELLQCQSDKDSIHIKMIELWYNKAMTLATAGFVGSETRWDQVKSDFARTVDLCEDIASTIHKQADNHAFSLDLGYLPAVFFCAIRCRDPCLRRRAIRVLEAYPRRESMWESTAAGVIARRWMDLEEEGLGAVSRADQIPESKRIAILDIEVDSANSTAALRLTPSLPGKKDRVGQIDEKIAWNESA